MNKRTRGAAVIWISVLVLILTAGAFLYIQKGLVFDLYYQLFQRRPVPEVLLPPIQIRELNRQVAAPEPLRAEKLAIDSQLTSTGILHFTNLHRAENELPPLAENGRLNDAALKKAEDIFARQYFQHISPTGQDAADLADQAGYKYLRIGENLALGNFRDDQDLVQGWMDSPGHRENILNPGYLDIGVAALQGTFESQKVWVAVQIFGTPIDVCPQPNEDLLTTIELNLERLESMEQTLAELRQELKTLPGRGRADKIAAYNQLVATHNELAKTTESLIKQYNAQVNEFNLCLTTYST